MKDQIDIKKDDTVVKNDKKASGTTKKEYRRVESQAYESQIKMTLMAAKDISEAGNEHGNGSMPRGVALSRNPQIRANQRRIERLLTSGLMKAGVELDTFEEIYAQNQTELRRIQKEQEDEAIKRSSSFKDSLRHGVESRGKTIKHLAELQPSKLSAKYELLDKPFLIWQTQGIKFPETHVEPANSSAKFNYFSDKSSGHEELSFYFLWENPSDKFAVINVDAYLVLNGFCSVTDGKSLFSGYGSSNLYLQSRLIIHEWWNQPPTSPLYQSDLYQHVLSLSAEGGLLSGGDIDGKHIHRGYDLRYNLFLMPPMA